VNRAPWEYLFIGFNTDNFAPIFDMTWRFAFAMLLVAVVFYNFQGRRMRNYAVFLDLNEWLLWTSIGVFSLLLMYAVFGFDFIFVLPTMVGGAILFAWIRFVHFPSAHPGLRGATGPPALLPALQDGAPRGHDPQPLDGQVEAPPPRSRPDRDASYRGSPQQAALSGHGDPPVRCRIPAP